MSISRIPFALAGLVAMMSLGSCATLGSNPFGPSESTKSLTTNPALAALQGGLVSRIAGLQIDDTDKVTALKTEYKALEAAPGGQELVWQGRGMTGQVVAAAPFQVGSQNCRQYRQTVIAQGQTLSANGTACRNETGTWTPLS